MMANVAETVALAASAVAAVAAAAAAMVYVAWRDQPRRGRSEPWQSEAQQKVARNADVLARIRMMGVGVEGESIREIDRAVARARQFVRNSERLPTREQLRRLTDSGSGRYRRLSDVELDAVLLSVGLSEFGPPPVADPAREVARRRVGLALRFLPSKEREHYRIEWGAEVDSMSPAVAARFAANVLLRAPLAGISLRFAKIFGRQAA
ncbi:hypothetical protein ABZ593_20935 [Streptomyces sp. NPDC012617]|uniref:hypothetical protein n=1 Tax=Streptomyces TaxID=1883 RepID=UPI0033CA65CA